MAKGTRGRRGIASRQCRPTPYPLPCYNKNDMHQQNCSKLFKKDWEDATCSVCMECPHNAVLLLCSSYEKGCRPYMCGTSFRYSNCLDQYKKAYSKEAVDPTEVACPLCRGQVKGWTVVDPAREHLNAKKRSCMQDDCSFVGTFKELRKHVKTEHPSAKPREVDPTLEQKWRRLEREREREDVMSTIRSSTPGAVFFGDYVIEGSNYAFDSDDDEDEGFNADDVERMSVFFFLQAFGSAGHVGPNRGASRDSNNARRENTVDAFEYSDDDSDSDDDNVDDVDVRRGGRVFLGRSGRRHRGANGGRR